MLEFVHLTGADAGKDAQTRRKVRSQAMRDYRRRQRQSREASTKTSESPQPSRSSTRRGTLVNQESLQCASPGSSTSWSLPHIEGIHVDDAGNLGTSMFPDEGYALPMGTSTRTTSETLHGRNSPHVISQEVDTSRPSAKFVSQHTIPSALSSTENLRWSTHAAPTWYNDMDDHFQSPELVNVMFNFCQSYVQWLVPRTSCEVAGRVMASAMNHSVRPFLLAACCLASVGHLDAVQPNRPGGNYEFYKARVLREVRQRMKSSATATAHETVSALALLTSFEMSRCSEEALTHLQGLKTIAGSSIPTMLETLDLLHAILFDSTLIFDTYGAIHPFEYDEETRCLKDQSMILSLLHIEHEEALRISSNAQLVLILQHYAPLMQSMSSAILGIVVNARNSMKASEAQRTVLDTYQQRLDGFWESTCRLDRATDSSVSLAQACYFQHSLLRTAVARGALTRSEGCTDLVCGLYESLRNTDDAAWAGLPYTHLVILLYGAATARHASHKSYFKAQLVKVIYQLGPKEWRRVRNLMIKFVSLRAFLNVPGSCTAASSSSI